MERWSEGKEWEEGGSEEERVEQEEELEWEEEEDVQVVKPTMTPTATAPAQE